MSDKDVSFSSQKFHSTCQEYYRSCYLLPDQFFWGSNLVKPLAVERADLKDYFLSKRSAVKDQLEAYEKRRAE